MEIIAEYLANKSLDKRKYTSEYGETILILACRLNCSIAIVESLYNPDLEIDARDNFGNTALGHASDNSNTSVYKFLMNKGARKLSKNLVR